MIAVDRFIKDVGEIAATSDSDVKNSPLDATCWFIANEVVGFLKDMSTRDLANEVCQGIGPYLKDSDVDIWFQSFAEETDEIRKEQGHPAFVLLDEVFDTENYRELLMRVTVFYHGS